MQKLKFVGLFFLIIVFLSVKPLFSQTGEIRILKLLVVADKGYREQIPDWQEETAEFIKIASLALEQETGIKLKIVKFEDWQRDTEGREEKEAVMMEIFKDFPRIKNAGFDIVMGLTSHYSSGAQGYIWPSAGYILITNKSCDVILDKYRDVETKHYLSLSLPERKSLLPSLILHELGHAFGCDEINKKDFIMASQNTGSLMFSKENIKTIKKNKWRKFPTVKIKSAR